MPVTLTFEKGPCSRCGGSGSYSYCQMYGTTCFKCSGRKVALTRAGAKAANAISAFRKEHFSVPVSSLKPGDFMMHDGRARRIKDISTVDAGRYGSTDPVTKEVTWRGGVTVTFVKPYKTAFGVVDSIGMVEDAIVEKGATGADWDRVVAFARTIKKGVTVTEAAAPAAVAS